MLRWLVLCVLMFGLQGCGFAWESTDDEEEDDGDKIDSSSANRQSTSTSSPSCEECYDKIFAYYHVQDVLSDIKWMRGEIQANNAIPFRYKVEMSRAKSAVRQRYARYIEEENDGEDDSDEVTHEKTARSLGLLNDFNALIDEYGRLLGRFHRNSRDFDDEEEELEEDGNPGETNAGSFQQLDLSSEDKARVLEALEEVKKSYEEQLPETIKGMAGCSVKEGVDVLVQDKREMCER